MNQQQAIEYLTNLKEKSYLNLKKNLNTIRDLEHIGRPVFKHMDLTVPAEAQKKHQEMIEEMTRKSIIQHEEIVFSLNSKLIHVRNADSKTLFSLK